ncbi:MAG: hypothetical protein ABEI52_02310, partial [Halobacteriaceae archaeon]
HGLLFSPDHGMEFVIDTYIEAVERAVTFTPEVQVGVNEVEVEGMATTGDTVGYILHGPSTIAYTGVTGYGKPDIDSQVDVFIIHCPHVSSSHRDEMDVEDATVLVDKVEPEIAVLTGFGPDASPLSMARTVQKETGVNTNAAKDGLVIDPDTFSSSVRQKRLREY